MTFESTAANGDERQQVGLLIGRVQKYIDGLWKFERKVAVFEADKGYDAHHLRVKLLKSKIFPWICRRKKTGKMVQKVKSVLIKMRWKVERAISWLQRKFRRLAVRWERKVEYWKGFLAFGLINFWINRLVR